MKIRILSINPEPVQKGSIIEYVKMSSGKKISKLDLILQELGAVKEILSEHSKRLDNIENRLETVIRLNNLRTE